MFPQGYDPYGPPPSAAVRPVSILNAIKEDNFAPSRHYPSLHIDTIQKKPYSSRNHERNVICCCIRTRHKKRFWLSVAFLIISGLALMGFFLWPRTPAFSIGEIQTFSALSTINDQLFLKTNFQTYASVASENYINWNVENIKIEVFVDTNKNLTTSNTGHVTIVARSVTTIPIRVEAVTEVTNPLSAALESIATACEFADRGNVTAPQNATTITSDRTFKVNYKVTASLGFLRSFGVAPSHTGQHDVPCPPPFLQ